MYQNIKLNKGYWKRIVPFLKYGTPDPLQVFSDDHEKFSAAMKAFKINGVNKNTRSGRHRETQLYLSAQIRNLGKAPAILDIGASDGVTSLEMMRAISDNFKKYYVTDYNIKCDYVKYKGYTYFFNSADNCFMIASRKFIFYPVNKRFFDFLFKKRINKIKNEPRQELLLINKELQAKKESDDRIEIMRYNVFEPWTREKVDVLIVGNLLHEVYFTRPEIREGLCQCYDALVNNGILVMIRNTVTDAGKNLEKSTVYKKNGASRRFEKVLDVNEGVEINEFLLSLNFSYRQEKPTLVKVNGN